MKSTFSLFRLIAFLEGISYIVLLFNMLVIKNVSADLGKMLVYPIGMAHGVLFVGYLLLALIVKFSYKRSLVWLVVAFIVSLIPFGTFFMERKWKQEEQDYIGNSGEILLTEN